MTGALECRPLVFELEAPFENAVSSWVHRDTLCVTLQGADGNPGGRGEAAPLPGYSRDNLEMCGRALGAIRSTDLQALEPLQSPAQLLERAAALVPEDVPAARFALETALLDRLGRRQGRPLWSLLRELVPGSTDGGAAIELCALLPSADVAAAVAEARLRLASGMSTFKLKIGPGRLQSAQAATLRALRETFGDVLNLRLDANGSLARTGLGATLRELASYAPEFVEEPIHSPEPRELADAPCPLALDECLQSLEPSLLRELLALSACHTLVLKPTALGGFSRCLQLARLARAAGCEVVVSHAIEGPIGWAACVHLALALAPGQAQGLWPLRHQQPSHAGPRSARVVPPAEAGLGVLS
jgi:o-succinylbenzoate synthase